MKLLNRIRSFFTRDTVETDVITVPVEAPKQEIKGHVVSAKKTMEYNPFVPREGGRVVKAMPRQLRKIKDAQESKDVD